MTGQGEVNSRYLVQWSPNDSHCAPYPFKKNIEATSPIYVCLFSYKLFTYFIITACFKYTRTHIKQVLREWIKKINRNRGSVCFLTPSHAYYLLRALLQGALPVPEALRKGGVLGGSAFGSVWGIHLNAGDQTLLLNLSQGVRPGTPHF